MHTWPAHHSCGYMYALWWYVARSSYITQTEKLGTNIVKWFTSKFTVSQSIQVKIISCNSANQFPDISFTGIIFCALSTCLSNWNGYTSHFLFFFIIHSFIHSFTRSFIHSFTHSFTPSFVRSIVRSFLRSCDRSFVRSLVRSFVRSLVRSFVLSFVRSFIHSFIHSFTNSLINILIN